MCSRWRLRTCLLSQRPHPSLGALARGKRAGRGGGALAPPTSPAQAVRDEEAPPPAGLAPPRPSPSPASSLLPPTLGRAAARTSERPADCSSHPGGKSDMAAAKTENLSLVVHGPGDLRLVRREGEWGAEPDPALWPWLEPRWASSPIPARPGPAPHGSRPLRSWFVTMLGGGGGRRLTCDAKSRVGVARLPEPSPRPARGWSPGRLRDDRWDTSVIALFGRDAREAA